MPFESEAHDSACLADTAAFRRHVEKVHADAPELFPARIDEGFVFYGSYHWRKHNIRVRRITLSATGDVFQIRPSFLMPNGTGATDEVEKALYLRQWGVPFDALAYVFGRDPMYWYRAWCALVRPSLVGTTIRDASRLPEHLVVDEKHTSLAGQRVYVPTTVARGWILGASVVASASAEDLTAGYGEFAEEARELDANYAPETVCTDGWEATASAWRAAFPGVASVLCFLHSVMKMRDKCRKNALLRREVLERA